MRFDCYICGEDCSHAHGTWKGYPVHIGCIPRPPRKPPVKTRTAAEEVEAVRVPVPLEGDING